MTTLFTVLVLITLILFIFTCWCFSQDSMEGEIVGILLTVLFFAFTLCIGNEGSRIKGLEKQQKMAIELGATPLTQDEVYKTSQAELDKLLKIGNVYYYVTK